MGVIIRGLITKGVISPAIPTYITSTVNTPFTSVATVSQTPTSPLTAGDLMISVIAITGGAAVGWTPPAGWTEVIDQGASPNLHISWKIATSSETAAVWTATANPVTGIATILGFRNALLDVVGTTATPVTGTNTMTVPAITTTANNAVVVLITGGSTHNGGQLLSNYTSITTQFNTAAVQAQYIVQVTAGSTGTVGFNFSSGSGNATGVLVSIKPK